MRRGLGLFLSLFLFLSLAKAEQSLSWQQSLELLKKNSAEYQAAEMSYRSTEALQSGAQSGYWPSLSGSLGYSQTKTDLDSLSDYSSTYSASLTLSQNIFSGLKDSYKINQAQANTRGARATFQIARATLSSQFVSAYQSVLTAQENLKLSEAILRRRQENLRLVELRFESGRENKGSVLLSEAYLADAKLESMKAQHELTLQQETLAHFLGLPPDDVLKINEPVPVKRPEESLSFQQLAVENPTYQQILATIDSNIAAVGVARAGFLPSLSLTGSLGRNGPNFFPENDRWSVAASLTIPLFDGGRDVSAVTSTGLTRDSSQWHKISVDQGLIESLRKAHQNFIEAVEKLNVDESFQKAAVMRSEIARSQYNNGLISFTDWDSIESDLINRQKAYVQSKKNRVLSEASWNLARGEGVFQ